MLIMDSMLQAQSATDLLCDRALLETGALLKFSTHRAPLQLHLRSTLLHQFCSQHLNLLTFIDPIVPITPSFPIFTHLPLFLLLELRSQLYNALLQPINPSLESLTYGASWHKSTLHFHLLPQKIPRHPLRKLIPHYRLASKAEDASPFDSFPIPHVGHAHTAHDIQAVWPRGRDYWDREAAEI
jgi:hypothetical protein